MKIDSENRANEKIAGFEAELVQMRERSQKILADKDNEIEILRKQNDGTEAEQSDSVGQLMLNGDANSDTALIMYAEQVIHCIFFCKLTRYLASQKRRRNKHAPRPQKRARNPNPPATGQACGIAGGSPLL